MALGDKIRERELRPQHILVASILAGLNEMGMINQASLPAAPVAISRTIPRPPVGPGSPPKSSPVPRR